MTNYSLPILRTRLALAMSALNRIFEQAQNLFDVSALTHDELLDPTKWVLFEPNAEQKALVDIGIDATKTLRSLSIAPWDLIGDGLTLTAQEAEIIAEAMALEKSLGCLPEGMHTALDVDSDRVVPCQLEPLWDNPFLAAIARPHLDWLNGAKQCLADVPEK